MSCIERGPKDKLEKEKKNSQDQCTIRAGSGTNDTHLWERALQCIPARVSAINSPDVNIYDLLS